MRERSKSGSRLWSLMDGVQGVKVAFELGPNTTLHCLKTFRQSSDPWYRRVRLEERE